MTIQRLNPLTDPRWSEFLARHPQASIFHTTGWLQALRLTYGYEPAVFTTSNSEKLSNGIVFCEVKSWLTGRRLISVPFADHCQPLASGDDCRTILESLDPSRGKERWKYIELRPVSDGTVIESFPGFTNSESFSFQTIDLGPDLEAIYRGFHDSCVRRKIKRAEREKLVYENGRSEELLQKFRYLFLLTRRRHKLPPQPAVWFRNLAHYLGEALTVHVLSKDGHPIASILTLRYKKSLIYKYGCSDAQFHNLGGTPLLFWKAIQQAKQMGLKEFDLGRSAPEDPGLIAFKEHLGAAISDLRYYRSPASRVKEERAQPGASWARQVLARLPDPLLAGAGRLLYRHFA
jgi:CelD/BcsL family acetyltransferase involved in cellulose biosynthesis